MNVFQEVYDRIRLATNARTQVELADVLEIRQSSISDAKRRDSVPADWYMKLFEKFGLNPDWLKKGTGPMYLRRGEEYGPAEAPADGVMEAPRYYGDPVAKCSMATVFSTVCEYREGVEPPLPEAIGKVALPQSFLGTDIRVLRVDSDALAPTVVRGAYVGVNTSQKRIGSGSIHAVFTPHEGIVLKRLFLDGDPDYCLLRADDPRYPESRIPTPECERRLFGRVIWVLQNL